MYGVLVFKYLAGFPSMLSS